jgi:hypothetical protein
MATNGEFEYIWKEVVCHSSKDIEIGTKNLIRYQVTQLRIESGSLPVQIWIINTTTDCSVVYGIIRSYDQDSGKY